MGLIKTIVFVRKKDGMSYDDFAAHWVEKHGKITSNLPGLNRLVFNLAPPKLQRRPLEWDGLSCAWFESREALSTISTSPAYKAMMDDEENFVDTSKRSPLIIDTFEPLGPKSTQSLNTPDIVKTVTPIWRKPDVSQAAFYDSWRNTHSKLICDIPNLQHYIQNTIRTDIQTGATLCDAVAECWWTSMERLIESVGSDAYTAVQEDEKSIADVDRLAPMIVKEVEIVSGGNYIL